MRRNRRLVLPLVACAILAVYFGARTWTRGGALEAASAAYARGDWNGAETLARAWLKAHTGDPIATRLVARSAAWLGLDDSALIHYHLLDEARVEPEDRALLGRVYLRIGRIEAALESWDGAIGQDGDPAGRQISPALLDEMARVMIQRRRVDPAVRAADLLARKPGWEARGAMLLGTIRASLGDPPGAAAAFRTALEADPEEAGRSQDPSGLRKLIARTFLRTGTPAEARVQLLAVLDREPDREASWLLSRAYLQEGETGLAREALALSGPYRSDNPLEPDPAPYVGEARCEKCHSAIFRDSLASRHTQGFYRGEQIRSLPRPDRPLADPDDGWVRHVIEEREGKLREITRMGDRRLEAIVEYAFGASDRYMTPVTRDPAGRYRILRMSYYQTDEGRGWDRTALDHLTPGHAEDYQGEEIGTRDGVAKCLSCHATNPRVGKDGAVVGPEGRDRAVGCERCHGPGGNHLAAVEARFPDMAIVNPTGVSPDLVTRKQCNDCHILGRDSGDEVKELGWLRSQGFGWGKSRCNTESGGAFGCTTCHDPHRGSRSMTTAQYEARCLSCHGPASATGTDGRPTPAVRRSACPVESTRGCLGCHMPKVRIPSLHLELTDHHIRRDAAK
jgi:predicted negative regulator of RcsB-dependent stress response